MCTRLCPYYPLSHHLCTHLPRHTFIPYLHPPSIPPSPPPLLLLHFMLFPLVVFPTGEWLDGLDLGVVLWSHRGRQGLANRSRYQRQLCLCKYIPTNTSPMQSIVGTVNPPTSNMYPITGKTYAMYPHMLLFYRGRMAPLPYTLRRVLVTPKS